ncbi:phenolphthiocerol synthesis polyketide synthase type I Pks15/1 domain protein [Mycobacterium ulcerans str. Harvey]|uniref:Phenolphthiocerol synthesis polyketide synthase type I Pks15/1 domain protein n=1 Tax=Mycobacterium ulcerans str. Harvey TaxID=1299332 RepID=A0ABP3AJI2_MYCUL|nr:phenolphthiocerol synthesis polyketide synthase type I Pks15/1 domain protein [Mycobacterium ulcerans str. Harvey]
MLGQDVQPVDIFNHPTVGDLVQILSLGERHVTSVECENGWGIMRRVTLAQWRFRQTRWPSSVSGAGFRVGWIRRTPCGTWWCRPGM